MSVSKVTLLAALGGFTLAASSAFAAPLVAESFDGYANAGDNVAGNNGGTGFAGAWSNTKNSPDVYADGAPAGQTMTGSGNYLRGSAWSGVAREIGPTLLNAGLLNDGAELWFSVRVGLNGQNQSNADIGFALSNAAKFASGDFGNRENLDGATSEGIGISHSRGVIEGAAWQNDDGAADTFAEKAFAASSVTIGGNNPDYATVVGKINWGVGAGDETLTLYDENLVETMAAQTFSAMNQTSFDMLLIQFKDRSQVDEIFFGATSSDVVIPEPGSLALLGLGGLLIARRRRG